MSVRKVRVLLADDSEVTRMFLVHLLESDSQICVIGAVVDGQAAVDFITRDKPDVVLMDIHMPRMDGFEATRRIMETNAVPIIICSATSNIKDVIISFRAMEAGAVACVEKPLGCEHSEFEAKAALLLETVKLMAEVKVVQRSPRARLQSWTRKPPEEASDYEPIHLIGIGASTGGPPVLQKILAELPKDFPLPMLVVQHIAPGFLAGMIEWLNQSSSLQVQAASFGVIPQPCHVYLAPDDFHMGIGEDNRVILTRDGPEGYLRPAVSFLFRSLAEVCGPRAVGVLLTGMGKDGAAELKLMKDRGAITLAQDRDSSVVHGMPGAAIALGGVTHVLSGDRIANRIVTLIRHRNGLLAH